MTGTLQKYLLIFTIISHGIILRINNVSDKICREFKSKVTCQFFFWIS